MSRIQENMELKQRQERIYLEFKDKVTRYIRGKISNTHDAEDIASDVFVKVFKGLAGFDESRASLSTWIYTITRNAVTDYFRTAKCFCEIPETACAKENIEERFLNEEMLSRLADALLKLTGQERDIIILHYHSGRTLKDIAKMMHISYSYARLIHTGALARLRGLLELKGLEK